MPSRTWNDLILTLTDPHLLQTSQWAAIKSGFGWQPHYLLWQESGAGWETHYSSQPEFPDLEARAAALVLERRVFPGLSVMYSPKGPLLDSWADTRLVTRVLADLEEFARGFGALQLKIDPDLPLGWGVPGEEDERASLEGRAVQGILLGRGWRFSQEQIQYRNTVLVDLTRDEEDILADMKSKTRYNIRLAARKGIQVRPGGKADLTTLYRMYADTSVRAGFTIRGQDYYQALWETFLGDGDPGARPLLAEYNGLPVAGAVIFKFGKKAWYLHGMSTLDHTEKMAPHLIQWEAIRWARSQGCAQYDMWGAPDEFQDSDPLWGVYRFKSGYGGVVARTLGAWDFPAQPLRYYLYTGLLPRILDIMRWFGDRRTREAASGELPGG